MRPRAYRIGLLVLASVLLPAGSCSERPKSGADLSPPVKLLTPPAEPQMSPRSLESEEVYEEERNRKIEWGRGLRDQMLRACKWFRDAGVKLECVK